jgi:hypothetical protein
MKKLLALVLCVMMFVAVIPTAAFADAVQPAPVPADPTDAWPSVYASNKAISNAKKNIEYLYNGLAADNAVFSGIKAMDSFVVDLAKGLFTDVDDYTYTTRVWDVATQKFIEKKYTVSNDTLVKNTKAELRSIIGDSISDYMNDHIASYAEISTHFEYDNGTLLKSNYVDAAGRPIYVHSETGNIYSVDTNGKLWYNATANAETTIEDRLAVAAASGAGRWAGGNVAPTTVLDYQYDPIKYANTFATAMSKALTSNKGAKGLEAYVYGLMQAKVAKEVDDKFDDFWDAVEEWEDGTAILDYYGWNENSLDPYAFINPFNLPKASMDMTDIVKPDATSFSWTWNGTDWVA